MGRLLGNPVISVIMPAYNEEEHIEACFNRVVRTLRRYGRPFEIILEEDGSTDRTPEIIDRLARRHPFVKALHHPRRMGKGWGMQKCMYAARGDVIVLIDADGEYPPERIPDLVDAINGADMVIGSRRGVGRGGSPLRAVASRMYGIIVKGLFGIRGFPGDPQAGFKALRRSVIETVGPLSAEGFDIDSEIIIKAMMGGFKITSITVPYSYKGQSKVNALIDPIKMFFSMLRWWRKVG